MSEPILETRGLTKAFGGNKVIPNLDFQLTPGLITTLVGPNGAGKTTIFNLITGFFAPDAGEVLYHGRPLNSVTPSDVARLGIGRSFQNLRLFRNMTVYENVLVSREKGLRDWWNRANRRRVEQVLERTNLLKQRDTRAADLSYAEQKFLSLARLMVMDADLLLLDEPTSGLDGLSLKRFQALLRSLQQDGRTILLIEHNLDIVREISDRIAFLDGGRLLAHGTPEEIFAKPELAEIYFGSGGTH